MAFANWRFDDMEMPASEGLGLLAAVVVLLVAFGSVLAMGLPIITAVLGIMIASSLIAVLARFMSTPDFTVQVASMIGLGVGIDYALFIVSRYRDALSRLRPPEDAVVEALTTAGRAVLFAGCTVMISVLGMLLMGLSFLYGLAVGTSIAVAISVAAALTLLPALLGFIGFNIDKLSVHRKNRKRTRISLWTRWADFVQRRPIPIAAIGFIVLAAASMPVFGLRLGMADAGNNPESSTTKAAYDLTASGFGAGANGPMLIVADTSGGSAAGLGAVTQALRSTPGVVMATDFQPSPNGGKAAIATLIASTGPQDKATESLVHHLRNDVLPAATAGTGVSSPRRRADRSGHGLRHQDRRPPPDLHRRRPAAQLPAAAHGLPVGARAAQGRPHEPAVDRRRLRRDGGGVPVGLVRLDRGRQRRSHRGLGPDDALRHRVRPLHGLRGLPALVGQGGVGRHR